MIYHFNEFLRMFSSHRIRIDFLGQKSGLCPIENMIDEISQSVSK